MSRQVASPLARRLLAVLFTLTLVVPMAPAADAKGLARHSRGTDGARITCGEIAENR